MLSKLSQFRCAQTELGRTFRLLAVSAVLYNLGVSLILFLYGLFLLGLGWREQAIGVMAGVLVLGGVVGVVPMAWLTRVYGFRRVLSGSLFAAALAFAGRTLLLGYHAQLLLSFVAGVCLSGWIVCVSPAIANSVGLPGRPAAFSMLFALSVSAGGLGSVLGGYLPTMLERHGVLLMRGRIATAFTAGTEGERCTLLVGCLLLALAAVPASRLPRGTLPFEPPKPIQRNSLLLRCFLASACWSLAVGLFNPFVSLFFVRQLAVPLGRLSLIFCVVQCVQAIALVGFNGRLQTSWGLVPTLVLLQASAGLTLILLAHGRVPIHAAVLYGLFMVLQRLCDPVLQCALMNVTRAAERSMATAFFYFAWSTTQAVSANIGGSALQHFGYSPVLVGAGIAAIAAAAASALLLRRMADPVESGLPSAS